MIDLGRFEAECEAVGMRVSTSKSEAIVLCRKMVDCALRVEEQVTAPSERVHLSRGLAHHEWRIKWFGRWTGGLVQQSAVMRVLYQTIVVKRELSRKAKLSIYQSIYVLTLTYGHELWVVTERMRSRIQAAKMSFLS